MTSDTKKISLPENASNKPRLICEGLLMYPERLDLGGDEIDTVIKSGYVIELGGRSFVLSINKGK